MILVPVDDFRWVKQANIANETFFGVITLFKGVFLAIFFKFSSVLPSTKFVATAAGETDKRRIFGPNALAREIVIVSIAAFAAQYAILLPDPVNAETEETFTIVADFERFINGTKVLIIE